MKNYYDLCSAIVYNYYNTADHILSRDKNIDLRYKNGNLFIQAVENDRVEILKLLIEYYQNNQLAKHTESSFEYSVIRSNLINILQTAIEDVKLSPEMKQVLSSYLNFENSNSDITNLSDVSVENLGIEEKLTPSENLLTEENLRILNQEFTSQDEKNSLQDVLAVPESSIIHEEAKLSGDLVQDNPDLV